MNKNKYTTFKTSELTQFLRRDVRTDVLEQLRERIEKGFNPARPLTIVQKDGKNIVADGNHRLQVLKELGIEDVPCVIREGNEYSISIECNNDEDTFAPEDLFDRLQTIQALKNEGHTQQEIGDIMGMSRDVIKFYNYVIDKIGTNILDLCKIHQNGRVPQNGTNVPLGANILDLCKSYQQGRAPQIGANAPLVANILDLCKTYQTGRATSNVANATTF